ncbi:DNA polymerase I [bacterium]|nr:DNA polymerase I [bacterium]
MNAIETFDEIWLCDFEFMALKGERPRPICMVARELRSGRLIRLWKDELTRSSPPFRTDSKVLFVAYYAAAELGCFRILGWSLPVHVLDLFAEFRCLTNGRLIASGNGLLGAMAYFGLDTIDASEKEEMRRLALRGGPYVDSERFALLDYCQSDVDALAKLMPIMTIRIDLPLALLRGRYMAAVASMEETGVPIDTQSLARFEEHWETIKSKLIERVDTNFGVYDGLRFKTNRFADWLSVHEIPWPRLPSGALELRDDVFREMARIYPAIAPLRELRHTIGELRLFDLAVGSDRRNRCMLSAFRSKTGRNQPGNSEFIFGPSCWLRGLIKPEPGRGIAYIDYAQQEFGIAAALSGDEAMLAAYRSADPYLKFAVQAGAAPHGATKLSHGPIREQFKTCALGVLYGLGEVSLGQKIGKTSSYARELLRLHQAVFPRFWRWSQAAVDTAILFGKLQTVFGWTIRTGSDINPRSLRNFPMQSNGAEILRLACSMLTEAGIHVCAPVHDAVLVEADLSEIDQTVERTRRIMEEASRIVLGGFTIGTDAKVIRFPDRYMDPRGEAMWNVVSDIVREIERPSSSIINTAIAGRDSYVA